MDSPKFEKQYRSQFAITVKHPGWEAFKRWIEAWETKILEEQRAIVSDPQEIALHNQRSGALLILEKIKYLDIEVHETLNRIMEHDKSVEIPNSGTYAKMEN